MCRYSSCLCLERITYSCLNPSYSRHNKGGGLRSSWSTPFSSGTNKLSEIPILPHHKRIAWILLCIESIVTAHYLVDKTSNSWSDLRLLWVEFLWSLFNNNTTNRRDWQLDALFGANLGSTLFRQTQTGLRAFVANRGRAICGPLSLTCHIIDDPIKSDGGSPSICKGDVPMECQLIRTTKSRWEGPPEFLKKRGVSGGWAPELRGHNLRDPQCLAYVCVRFRKTSLFSEVL